MKPEFHARQQLASLLEGPLTDFEQAWLNGDIPDVQEWYARMLAASGNLGQIREVQQQVLFELLAIDLEFRWKNQNSHLRPLAIDDHEIVNEVFGPREVWPSHLIAEEYRAWRRWGGRQACSATLAITAAKRRHHTSCFIQVDIELSKESKEATQPLRWPRDPRALLDSREFTLQSLIGSGGMGKVYRAWSPRLDRSVAVKFLRKSLLQFPAAIERFVDEAQILTRLQHPGIIAIHGLGQSRHGNYFLVMNLVENGDLTLRMQHGPVDFQQALDWGIEIASALELVHSQGVIHCDLKPANLLLTPRGNVIVTDFGLAARVSETPGCSAGGTAAYMAPEQVDSSAGLISPATDVYSLGIVLYQLLSGQLPPLRRWNLNSPQETQFLQVLRGPGISSVFTQVLERCLRFKTSERYTSMQELQTALVGVKNCKG